MINRISELEVEVKFEEEDFLIDSSVILITKICSYNMVQYRTKRHDDFWTKLGIPLPL